jgi:hypothetical protein
MNKIEKKILSALEDQDILDVYFDSGRLIYMNDWDRGAVRKTVQDQFPQFDPSNIIYDEEPEYFGKIGY